MGVSIYTQWSAGPKLAKPTTNEERDELFTSHVRHIAATKMPWLFPLLEACDASIYAEPGRFFFLLNMPGSTWLEIPEMGRLIAMVPWVEADETPQ